MTRYEQIGIELNQAFKNRDFETMKKLIDEAEQMAIEEDREIFNSLESIHNEMYETLKPIHNQAIDRC